MRAKRRPPLRAGQLRPKGQRSRLVAGLRSDADNTGVAKATATHSRAGDGTHVWRTQRFKRKNTARRSRALSERAT